MQCPRCHRPVIRMVYDSQANYGRGATVLWHGPGHLIGTTGLRHADCCTISGNLTGPRADRAGGTRQNAAKRQGERK